MNQKSEEERIKLLNLLKKHEEIFQETDGFYYFWQSSTMGFFSAHQLKWIAEELDRLNEPLYEELNKYHEENPTPEFDFGQFPD